MKAVRMGRKLHLSSRGVVTKCGKKCIEGTNLLNDITPLDFLQAGGPKCETCANAAGTMVLMGDGAKP